jgi:hypothetical protein
VLQKLVKIPELIQKESFNSGKNSAKLYQPGLKKTIKRNFTDLCKNETF